MGDDVCFIGGNDEDRQSFCFSDNTKKVVVYCVDLMNDYRRMVCVCVLCVSTLFVWV